MARDFRSAARKIGRLSRTLKRAAPSGLRIIGEEILTDVKASRPGHGVPVDTGALRASGRATGPRSDDSVLLSFGDAATRYALKQHEELDYNHEIGEARYLVRGVDRWKPDRSVAIAALKAQTDIIIRRIRAAP